MNGAAGAACLTVAAVFLVIQVVLLRRRSAARAEWREAMLAAGLQPVDTDEPEPAAELLALKLRHPSLDPRAEQFAWCLRADVGGLNVWILQPELWAKGETYQMPIVVAVRRDALLPLNSELDPPRWFVGLAPTWLFIWSDRGNFKEPRVLRGYVEEAIRMLRENGIAPPGPPHH